MRRRIYGWLLSITFLLTVTILYLQTHSYNNVIHTKITRAVTESAILKKFVTKSLLELRRSSKLSDHILFFNRVPNCGSEIIVLLMQRLQGANNFLHYRLKSPNRLLNEYEQEALVREVTNIIREKAVPLTFDSETYFINFTNFDIQSPTYFNMIRDPMNKLISRFFYKKNLQDNQNNPLDTDFYEKEVRKRIEDCIKYQNPECTFRDYMPYNLTIPYFCGQDPRCLLFNNPWATATAKSNVEKYFSLVGVLEELNATLDVMEHKHPYFFKGVQQIHLRDLYQTYRKEKGISVNLEIRGYFERLLVHEYDFYKWIKRRLFQQLQIMYPNH